jgi:hypothetical protein
MKILYIAGEHVSGALSLLQSEHRRRGDEARFITFWHSRWDFPDDICLNLPLMPNRNWIVKLRNMLRFARNAPEVMPPNSERPYWKPGILERMLFSLRDQWLWPRIERAINQNNLTTFDIVYLDGGLDFTRDGRFVKEMRKKGKHLAAFYHGTDMRTRGIIPAIDEFIELRLTSEWDLLEYDNRLQYLYLPIDAAQYPPREYHFHSPVRIGHASRNPYKGSEYIESAVRELSKQIPIELAHIKGMSYNRALEVKSECDIFVDQLTNAGGWGYGMSSVEALAMGLPVVTNIPPQMEPHLGNHPFIIADTLSVCDILYRLCKNENECQERSIRGREWVREKHDIFAVGNQLYNYFGKVGWINSR